MKMDLLTFAFASRQHFTTFSSSQLTGHTLESHHRMIQPSSKKCMELITLSFSTQVLLLLLFKLLDLSLHFSLAVRKKPKPIPALGS